MIVATIHEVPGRPTLEILGLAKGASIRSRHFGYGLLAFFRGLVGGELHDQTKVIAEAREQALDRAIEEARAMGADAIIGLRYTSTEVIGRAAEFVVYGTAVRLADEQETP
jgi:uncharacterized protein YbjQ (UPF0145 family)